MIKNSQRSRSPHQSPKKNHSNKKMSIFDFVKKSTKAIQLKSETALTKIHAKIIEDPSVYILPLGNRKKMSSKEKSQSDDRSLGKAKPSEISRSTSKMTEKDSAKISDLMKKKHDLMARLRKIDHELHNPSMLPVTFESNSNSSFVISEHDRLFSNKITQSRINQKQKNTYNVSQHQKTVEMLTRLNDQKMRRQERIVSDMKKKQDKQIKKLEQMEKSRSKVQFSKHSRNLLLLRAINKKQAEKLLDTQSAETPVAKETIPNEFDDVQENIQIGTQNRVPTEQQDTFLPEINP